MGHHLWCSHFVGINLDPQTPLIEPLIELRDAIFFSLPFPFLTHLLKRTSAQN